MQLARRPESSDREYNGPRSGRARNAECWQYSCLMGAAKACRVRDRFRAKLPRSLLDALALNWLNGRGIVPSRRTRATLRSSRWAIESAARKLERPLPISWRDEPCVWTTDR